MRFISVDTAEELSRISLPNIISLDCETDGLNERECNLLRVVVGVSDIGYSIYPGLVTADLFNGKTLILQNFKFDFKVLYRHSIDLFQHTFRDTMLMHHLIDETAEHGLDYLVKTYIQDNYKEVFWSKYKTYQEAPREEQLEYECKDAIYTYRLYQRFSNVLCDREKLVTQVHELARHLARTECFGVSVDVPRIIDSSLSMSARIEELGKQLRPCVDEYCTRWELEKWLEEIGKRKSDRGKAGVVRPEFNFGSGGQVQWLLYDAIGLPVVTRTKAGHPSTDYDTLSELSGKHPIVDLLKDYKGTQTLYNTFVIGILERQVDDKIYPEFNINGTVTGRISSSNPNLQNMPKDGPYRGFFIPSQGMVFFGADYSQLEVVVEANLSGDRNLRKILLEGASKHDITNQELGLNDRNLAKTLNFAMQYWCSTFKVKELLGVSDKEAQHIYNKYWEVYKGVKALKAFTDKRVDDGLPIVSPFGRERHFPDTFANQREEARAKRQAYNALIQGTGADITHLAFSRAARAIGQCGRMLWPIHDELLGECERGWAEQQKRNLVCTMEDITQDLEWELPLKAVAYGPLDRWTKA